MKRFIAGAVCPRCGLMDKLVVDGNGGERECVSCGFREQKPTEAVDELRTRVTRPAARRVDTPAEQVTLIQPSLPPSAGDDG